MVQTSETEGITNLINQKPDLMKSIEDEETAKILRDELYFPILKVLREGPMTVKELEEGYNSTAVHPKSDKTIYRYLKTLQDHDLVMSVGQRVVHGKTATETLFSRTAYAFYIRHEQEDFWKTDEGGRLSFAIGSLLSPVFDGKKPNVTSLQEFFYDLSSKRLKILEEYLDKIDMEVLEDISDLDWTKFTVFYDFGGLLAVLLNNVTLLDNLRKCFT